MKWLLCPATQDAWDVHPRRLRNKEFGDGAGKRLTDFMPTIRLRSVILLKGEEKKYRSWLYIILRPVIGFRPIKNLLVREWLSLILLRTETLEIM